MDVLKRVFEKHNNELRRHMIYVSDRRRAVESWISEGLGELHGSAGQTDGKVSFRQFINHQGATDQDVDLEGSVNTVRNSERVQDFALSVGWRASDPDIVFAKAGQTRLEISVVDAINGRLVDVVAQAIEKELERKRG